MPTPLLAKGHPLTMIAPLSAPVVVVADVKMPETVDDAWERNPSGIRIVYDALTGVRNVEFSERHCCSWLIPVPMDWARVRVGASTRKRPSTIERVLLIQ